MKKTQSNESKRSMKMLILFCVIVGTLIFGSLLLRLFTLMRESVFDSKHRYTVAFLHARELDIISLDPVTKAMTHMEVRGSVEPSTVFAEVGVIPDSIFILSKSFEGVDHVGAYITDAFFHKGGVSSSLSSYDLLRLSLFTKGISSAEVHSEEVFLPIETANGDILSKELFLDQAIADENRSVSVVNGAGTAGLGKRLERALENRGFSIISVANADEVSSRTQVVYSGEKGYSVEKIEAILNVKATQSEQQNLSDIIITLGKDQAKAQNF